MNKSSITKYIAGAVIVVAFVAYLIFTNKSSIPTTPVASPVTSEPSTTTSGTTATGSSSSTDTTTASGQYKDGIYTGSVADAFYGNLQAVVTVQNGMITDVTFPQSPSEGESGQISARALPVLRQEAITAQSAQVATVSGATQDSQAFEVSLASALSQAKS